MTTWGTTGVEVHRGGRVLLAGVDLPIEAGAVTAVVGGDGAGKSTLARVLTRRVAPDRGEVRMPAPARVGAVLHATGVYGDLTVDENLGFVADAYGIPVSDRGRRFHALRRRAGLDDARRRLGGELSGGMRQKLAVICALVPGPDVVVLDEPTTGVDPVSRAEVWRLLAAATADGAAVVMTTTYLDEAERAAHLLVLDDGHTMLAGEPRAVVADHDGVLVRTETPLDATSWRRGRHWRTWVAGEGPAGARRVAPRLEDVVIRAQQRARAVPGGAQ